MDAVDCLVIGAGVVGLAIARKLSRRFPGLVIVERHDGFGRETSSRNSEVIHAGFYYPENSLKATICVEGNRRIYEWCEREGVPYRRCGKIVVANTEQERRKIQHLHAQGLKNGVEGLRLLTKTEIAAMEPAVLAQEGLYWPTTGIFDTHQFMQSLEHHVLANGATVAYNCTVTGITRIPAGFAVEILDSDGQTMTLQAGLVINAAGLGAEQIASLAGIDPDAAGYRLHPCKGEYFRVSGRHRNRLSHLVYPAPTPISLGVHAVLGLDGGLRLGPNAAYVDALDYAVDPAHRHAFFTEARKYLPFVEEEDLSPDQSGIRPKLQAPGEAFHDFVIREEGDRGAPGLIDLIGIESPGLTGSLAIAERVAAMVHGGR
jgi:L-2-hydroxyglutarate oxidase LhgO